MPSPPAPAHARVRLRTVTAADYDALYELAVSPATGYRWRFRGATPSPQQFVHELHAGVLCQYVVETAVGDRVGLVAAYQPDLANGTAFLAVAAVAAHQGSGRVLEGTARFLSHLFATWPLRRIYAEVPGYCYADVASGLGRYFRQEGRLDEHAFHGGRYWPLHLLTVERDDWLAAAQRLGLAPADPVRPSAASGR